MVHIKNVICNHEIQDKPITEEQEALYYCNIGFFTYTTLKEYSINRKENMNKFNIEGNLTHFYYMLGWCVVHGYYD